MFVKNNDQGFGVLKFVKDIECINMDKYFDLHELVKVKSEKAFDKIQEA